MSDRRVPVRVRGVVLDFDGVLVRSMELHAEAYRRVLAPFDFTPSDGDVFELEGARSETLIRELLERNGHEKTSKEIAELAHEKQGIFQSLGPAPLYAGAVGMFDRIRNAADRLGLVTGTRRANLERLIPEMLPKLDAVLAQDAYKKDKPDPEPYARAVEALGLPPDRCAAVENAVRGIQSARRANVSFVVGITTTMTRDDLLKAGAHVVVSGHDEAAKAIEEWSRA